MDIAEAVHRGQREPSGQPHIDHVGRVPLSAPSEAASAAWRPDATFLAHVRTIAATPGPPGRIARAVKRADMEDRMRLPRERATDEGERNGLTLRQSGFEREEPDCAAS